jgi:hypothetical protein
MASLQKLPFRLLQPEALFIQLLLPPVDAVHHARKRPVLRAVRQLLTRHQQSVAHGALQPARKSSACASISCRDRITSSAAAEGVGARRSATKSTIVKSVSCPIAEITGIFESATARASPHD